MNPLEVTWWELIALIGMSQSLLLLVYMILRAGSLKNASLAILCFSCVTLAFFGDLGARHLSEFAIYPLLQDVFWHLLPVVFVLLSMQVAKIEKPPQKRQLLLFFIWLLTMLTGWALGSLQENCYIWEVCNIDLRRNILAIAGVISGAISLLWLWIGRNNLAMSDGINSYKSDRYWLILALIVSNCALIFMELCWISGLISGPSLLIIRNILGCTLVYIASTSLFRIYPQVLKTVPAKASNELTTEEQALVEKLKDLIEVQKVYQEASYSRRDLANELNIPEATVSKIVNSHFGKSVPQLLNERRITEAKTLLKDTDAAISLIAEQVGFNSLPSFNRVFKDIVGQTPSDYRSGK